MTFTYNNLNIKIETAIRLLSCKIPSMEKCIKPTLFHSIRVGVLLYENKYCDEIVLGGLLHDIVEDTDVTVDQIEEKFGHIVSKLVSLNTKDPQILDSAESREELLSRAAKNEEAAIIKAADILDNHKFYSLEKNSSQVEICSLNFQSFIQKLPSHYTAPIFAALRATFND